MTRCYAWPLTVGDGADLQLHVSTEHDRFGLRLFRYGATVEEVSVPAVVYPGHALPLGRPDEAWGWPRYRVPLGADLAGGIYLAVVVPVDGDGRAEAVEPGPGVATRPDACLFVLRRTPADGSQTVLYKLPTATYAAYNQLGGASLYAGAHWTRDWSAQGYVVSLQRPGNGGVGGRVMQGDAPDPYARGSRRQVFAHWDAPMVAWLEGHGYTPAYCTDFDLHYDDALLASATLLISAGHDEYWSSEMRRRTLEFVDRGGNVCFFAGDVACFVVEFAGSGSRLFCRKTAGGSPEGDGTYRSGALWHVADPEDWLSLSSGAYGGGWWDGTRAIDGYQPVVGRHWAFDGVDFPPEGLTGGDDTPVIGYETDGVPLVRASQPPRLSEARKGGGGGRTLLALASLSAGWVEGSSPQANAAIMFRTASSGGMVFSVGTTDWPLALGNPAIGRITENVLQRLVHRPLVLHGPICDDGDYLSDGDTVGAGQPVGWYVDGDQWAGGDLGDPAWTVVGANATDNGSGAQLAVTAADSEGWMTVTATARDRTGATYFGSRTVRVLGIEEYLRRRIVRALDLMAFPDEQGGALVDQRASEAELAARVIPVRLAWVQEHAGTLDRTMRQLAEIWTRTGRMAVASLRPDEK